MATMVTDDRWLLRWQKKKDDAMAETMTPSTMTAGQIDKAVANYRAMLEKHVREFGAEAVQTVLGQPELAGEQFAVFRRRVEALSNLVVRRVTVDRARTAQAALDATGRRQYTNPSVVDTMPRGEVEEVEVVFFKPDLSNSDGFISDDNLVKEFELRGLKPADPFSLAAVNEAEPSFADKVPHGTHWKDSDGNWCYATFSGWDGERRVGVHRDVNDWVDDWWFAGMRK